MAVAAPPTLSAGAPPRLGRRSTRTSPVPWIAPALLAAIVVAAVAGPMLWHQGPITQHIDARLQEPSLAHPLGTDRFGRDMLARLVSGARWSLSGALIVCVGTSAAGLLVAMAATVSGRLGDAIIARLVESLMALPGLVTALALTAALGPSFTNLLFALVVTGWPRYARIYRTLILKERAAPYVEGAIAVGASPAYVVLRHVLPNTAGSVVVLATASFGYALLGLAALSFIGLGMQPPTPEWGMMINDARAYFERFPWQMLAPGLCIVVTVAAVNLAGDSLRDALDPRLRRGRSSRDSMG